MSIKKFLGLAILLLAFSTGRAEAGLITYSETQIFSGSLGATSFTNANLTISVTANTANITGFPTTSPFSFGYYSVVGISNTFTIAGVGSGSILGTTFTVFNEEGPNPVAGLSLGSGYGSSSFDTTSGAFGLYDLSTSYGPISGGFDRFQVINTSFTTTSGTLNLSFSATTPTIFQAQANGSAVPEPSSFVLCGVAGLAGLFYSRFRGKSIA